MLKHLTIRNYALIRHLEFSPDKGLSVITGETGAGKSIMLGALGLLLGNRADSKVLLDEKEKCVTEGIFEIESYGLQKLFEELELEYGSELILRREISTNGKSRAFINDTPVNLESMRKVGFSLMDIHSQHETLELGDQPFQLKFIDFCSGNQVLLSEYKNQWQSFREAEDQLTNLEAEATRLNDESDYTRFQLQEFSDLQLSEGDQEKLEAKVKLGENAELIRSRLQTISGLLSDSEYSGIKILGEIRSLLSTIAGMDPELSELLKRIDSIKTETQDIDSDIQKKADGIEYDPGKLAEAQERLDLIYKLQRKHRVGSVFELIQIQERLSEKIFKTDHLDEEIAKCRINLKNLKISLLKKAEELSSQRKKFLPKISSEAESILKELGIPHARFRILHQKQDPGPTGIDVIDMQFSANKGVEPQPIAETASGGEFSRLMFAVKFIMAKHTSMPTLILDEIDAGISGDVALRLGQLMKKMSRKHQVISISHLAQIAAKSDTHFVVFKESNKDRTSSQIRLLEPEKRIEELARIISGNTPSDAALKYAQELMESSDI